MISPHLQQFCRIQIQNSFTFSLPAQNNPQTDESTCLCLYIWTQVFYTFFSVLCCFTTLHEIHQKLKYSVCLLMMRMLSLLVAEGGWDRHGGVGDMSMMLVYFKLTKSEQQHGSIKIIIITLIVIIIIVFINICFDEPTAVRACGKVYGVWRYWRIS